MTYRKLAGDHLYTGWDDAPKVSVLTREAGNPTDLAIEYISAVNGTRRTKVVFPSAFEYRWVDGDWDRVWPHPDDYEFGLIEILDSEFLGRMVESSPYRGEQQGSRLGAIPESAVHHYRLGFDDHGLYDVVSLECRISILES